VHAHSWHPRVSLPRIPLLTCWRESQDDVARPDGRAGDMLQALDQWIPCIAGVQPCENRGQAMRKRQMWIGIFIMITVLLLISTVPGHADRGGHGYKGHGHGGHGHKGHGHRGPRVFVSPRLVVPFGAYWRPYWEPYPYPPVVVAPAPRVYVEPSPPPPTYWYYCDAAQAYHPYVQQCPGGWRQVLPTPLG